MKKFKISIMVEVEDQSIEDMEYNAQQYIKDDIEDNALYIEDIEEVDPEPEEKEYSFNLEVKKLELWIHL